MDKLLEALKALGEGKGDKAEVAKLLKEHAGAVHQVVFQEGHNVGYGKKAGELTEATEKATTLTSENAQLKKDLDQARQSNPDIAKIHTDHKAQVDDLQKKHQEELDAVKGKLKATKVDGGKSALTDELVKLGVDRDYAKTVIANREDVVTRVRVDATGEAVEFLQSGGTIPIVQSGDKTPVQLLAEELAKGVPPKFITSQADGGAGGGAGGGGDKSGGDVAKLADEIRKEAKERREAEGAHKTGPGGIPEGISHLAVTGQ